MEEEVAIYPPDEPRRFFEDVLVLHDHVVHCDWVEDVEHPVLVCMTGISESDACI